MKNVPYSVAMGSTGYGDPFDFGGEEIARFKCKGDAYNYAKQVNEALGRATRVWNHAKKCQEFIFEATTATA